MKSGWKVTPLSTLCSVRRDSGIHRDMAYIGMEHIEAGTGRLLSLSNTDYVIGVTNSFRSGDLLYGKLRPYLKKVLVAETSGCCSTEILPITCKSDLIPEFLKYWFLEDTITERINATCGGCRMPRANMNDVFQFDFAYPCVEEQQRIVEVLDAEFAKIDALKANAEKNLQNAKDLFQASLKKELEPKDGWEMPTIPEISENLDYRRVPVTKKDRDCGNYPYYGASGIVDYVGDYIFDEDLLLVSEDGANLVARSTPIAFSISGKTWVNNHAHALRFTNITLQHFVEYFFESYDLSPLITGTAQPKLTQRALNSIVIPLPVNQQEISGIVERLDSLKIHCKALQENYNKAIALCDDLKQALLRKAFNGEL